VECHDKQGGKMQKVGATTCDLASLVGTQNKQLSLFLAETPEMEPIMKHATLSFNISIINMEAYNAERQNASDQLRT
jgi:hypothetical protein